MDFLWTYVKVMVEVNVIFHLRRRRPVQFEWSTCPHSIPFIHSMMMLLLAIVVAIACTL